MRRSSESSRSVMFWKRIWSKWTLHKASVYRSADAFIRIDCFTRLPESSKKSIVCMWQYRSDLHMYSTVIAIPKPPLVMSWGCLAWFRWAIYQQPISFSELALISARFKYRMSFSSLHSADFLCKFNNQRNARYVRKRSRKDEISPYGRG